MEPFGQSAEHWRLFKDEESPRKSSTMDQPWMLWWHPTWLAPVIGFYDRGRCIPLRMELDGPHVEALEFYDPQPTHWTLVPDLPNE